MATYEGYIRKQKVGFLDLQDEAGCQVINKIFVGGIVNIRVKGRQK